MMYHVDGTHFKNNIGIIQALYRFPIFENVIDKFRTNLIINQFCIFWFLLFCICLSSVCKAKLKYMCIVMH